VIRALAQVESSADFDAVTTAIRSVYLPWVEESARYLQKIWGHGKHERHEEYQKEDCVLFVDGLRFDCAKRLADRLYKVGCTVEEKTVWAALPSVTGTGKAAVAPIDRTSDRIAKEPEGFNFEPMTSYHLQKAIEENGYQILDRTLSCSFVPSVDKKIWVEFGDIDHEGHDRGWKLAKHIDTLIVEITDRITELLAAGWKRVRVVTDHGWLLLPGGLPKIDLPSALADHKWGRCASLKPGATSEERLYPWYWNPNQYFALADGVSCFKKGEEYTHGGLSLQECLTLQLTIQKWNSPVLQNQAPAGQALQEPHEKVGGLPTGESIFPNPVFPSQETPMAAYLEPRTPASFHPHQDIPPEFDVILRHIQQHGAITEAAITRMLGGGPNGSRKHRRFAKQIEGWLPQLPFEIQIEQTIEGKTYRKTT
jgi:hypothetical protein